ncbi:hypothetical protein QQX98_012501 [Neonectria punicea]|uniref:NB-ARC domain-containing protein n=1 Tax=Neonectria punicea TaxID=979145 RepID=A0ABR1GIR9_9HYPO
MRCHTIPFPQNWGFYGRDGILGEISHVLEQQASRVASVALWGTGGIGKTQIALEFAHRQWSAGVEVILWIASETIAEVSESFKNAARELQLEDYSESNTPGDNRRLVLKWLQNTSTPWILIFDNVENHKTLNFNWPPVGQGRIIVTYRSELLAESPRITTAIEAPPFTVHQSTELILKILNKSSAPESEIEATNNLSQQLGGIALAIDVIAQQIKVSRKYRSVAEFLPYYEQNHKNMLKRPGHSIADLSYSKDLDTVWETAFRNLSEDAAQLMQLLCFVSPEAIPQSLFEPKGVKVPSEWNILSDCDTYMIEIQHFLEAESSLLSLLQEVEPGSPMAAKTHRNLLGLYERTGRSILAVEATKNELHILETLDVPRDNDLANAHNNRGYALVSAQNAVEGLQYLDTAISMAKSAPEPERYTSYNLDRFLRNRGRAKQQLGRFDDALLDFDEAERIHKMVHGPNSHYDGETKHERAKIAAWQGHLDQAYSLTHRSYELVSARKPTHSSVMASQYRLGWVSMLQHNYERALDHFEKALVICQRNEQHGGNSGESARVKWRMAQIYAEQGMVEEANAFRTTAEETKKALLATGSYAIVDGEDASWDALLGLLYR